MSRGRKPQDETALKLRGTYRPDRHDTDPPPIADAAEKPATLDADAADVWNALSPALTAQGLLSDLDALAFEMLCTEAARWRSLQRMLAETGGPIVMVGGIPKANPALIQLHKSRDATLGMIREFGLTPAARRGIALNSKGVPDELEKLLKSRGTG